MEYHALKDAVQRGSASFYKLVLVDNLKSFLLNFFIP